MTRGRAENLIGQPVGLIGTADQIILNGNTYRVRVVLPGGIIQEFDETDVYFEDEEVRIKYERDVLLMLVLDETEFGPGAFKRAVEKLKAGNGSPLIAGVWYSDKEQSQANAIFLSDGTKISIQREHGASWMAIGKASKIIPMKK